MNNEKILKVSILENYKNCINSIPKNITLVAVSKTHPVNKILEIYNLGQRDFGENKVQELIKKYELLPKDIRWHQIGHLQSNKVKYIIPFIYLIHSVDSYKLLQIIDKEAYKHNRKINVLLEIKIAIEESKYGLSFEEARKILDNKDNFKNIDIKGLMGMASNIENEQQIKNEFNSLYEFFIKNRQIHHLDTLSIGMSHDYQLAISCGSTMVRIGSNIFGNRELLK